MARRSIVFRDGPDANFGRNFFRVATAIAEEQDSSECRGARPCEKISTKAAKRAGQQRRVTKTFLHWIWMMLCGRSGVPEFLRMSCDSGRTVKRFATLVGTLISNHARLFKVSGVSGSFDLGHGNCCAWALCPHRLPTFAKISGHPCEDPGRALLPTCGGGLLPCCAAPVLGSDGFGSFSPHVKLRHGHAIRSTPHDRPAEASVGLEFDLDSRHTAHVESAR